MADSDWGDSDWGLLRYSWMATTTSSTSSPPEEAAKLVAAWSQRTRAEQVATRVEFEMQKLCDARIPGGKTSDAVEVPLPEAPALPSELHFAILSQAFGPEGLCRAVSTELKHMADASRETLELVSHAPVGAIRAWLTRCSRVSRLRLRSCCHVDDDIVELALSSAALSTIDVSLCPLLTARTHGALKRSTVVWTAHGTFWTPSPLLTPEQVPPSAAECRRVPPSAAECRSGTLTAADRELVLEQVVINQVLALQDNSDDGMARTFAFASPANRAVTGPLDNFARMVRQGYSAMVSSEHAYLSAPVVRNSEAEHPYEPVSAEMVVVYGGPVEGGGMQRMRALSAAAHASTCMFKPFVFLLERQQEEGEYKDCWMTAGVSPLPQQTTETLPLQQLINRGYWALF